MPKSKSGMGEPGGDLGNTKYEQERRIEQITFLRSSELNLLSVGISVSTPICCRRTFGEAAEVDARELNLVQLSSTTHAV